MVKLSGEQIKAMIEKASGLELELVWIPRIMDNQTREEIDTESTRERNDIGLNAFDGKTIGAYFAKIRDGRHLNQKQIEISRKKLVKYAKQYSEMTA